MQEKKNKQLAYWEAEIRRNQRRMILDRAILAIVAGILIGLLVYVCIGAMKQTGVL